MKKLIGLITLFLLSATTAISADMRFVQVDGALYNSADAQRFENLVAKINKEKNVEFVVFTGNNISRPREAELEQFLLAAKKLKRPFYVVLGQKDVNKQKKLGKKEYMRLVCKKNFSQRKNNSPNYVFKKKNLVFVVADGSKEVIPSPNGYYKEDVILWLDEQLDKYADKKVIIFQHYPLIPPSQRETHYTHKADEYLRLLSEHKNVKAVFAGHFGVNKEQMQDGILHVSTSNAPVYRVVDILNYDSDELTFWSTIKE